MRLPVLIAALLFPIAAWAQVQQSGTVTPGHVAIWTTNGVAQDGGASSAGALTSLGITSSNAGSFCINDALTTSGGWHALCAGTTPSGSTLSYTAYGNGSTSLPFNFQLYGTTALSIAPSGITFDLPLDLSSLALSGSAFVGGTLSVTGPAALNGGGSLAGTYSGSPTFSGPLTLSATGTALSVTNGATFGAGGSVPLTLSSGTISAAGLLNFTATSGPGFAFNGTGGLGVIIGAPSSTVTGRLNIAAGTSNNPITFLTNNSSNTNQGFAFQAASGVGSQIIFAEPSFTGAYSAPASNAYNCGGIPAYVLVCGNGDALSGGAPNTLNVTHYFGGSGTSGGRIVANFVNILNAATGDTGNSFFQAGNFDGEMRANAGGTSGTARGSNFAFASYALLENGATYFVENAAVEHGLAVETGASVENLHGVSVILDAANAVAPSQEGIGFAVGAQVGATPTLTYAYSVGRIDSNNPLASTGTILGYINCNGCSEPTIANGINISGPTYTGNTWNDGHVAFDGSGEVNANSVSALSLSATDGFFDPPTTAGIPTGAPAAFGALAHCAVDTTNAYLNCYFGGAWHKIAFGAGAG